MTDLSPAGRHMEDLLDALGGITPTAEERSTLEWLAGWPQHTVGRVVGMIRRARGLSTCAHSRADDLGYTSGPIQRPDPTVAGMTLETRVSLCPDCDQYVATVVMSPRNGPARHAPAAVLRTRAGEAGL